MIRTLSIAWVLTFLVVAHGFMESWMQALFPVIGNATILDLSMPGTHDTLTYDLSTTVRACTSSKLLVHTEKTESLSGSLQFFFAALVTDFRRWRRRAPRALKANA